MRDRLRASVRLIGLVLVVLLLFVPVFVALRLDYVRVNGWLVQQFYRLVLLVLGVRVRVFGNPTSHRPALIMSNHISYLDVMVLGSITPLVFTPKKEIASWPVFGLFSRMCRSVFIDRRPTQTAKNRENLLHRLKQGDRVVIFPEGTTGDGNRLLPFRSSFFSLAEDPALRNLAIQPVTLAYTHYRGIPMGLRYRPQVAWYGDMDFGPHFWQLLKGGGFTAQVVFHEPLETHLEFSRKEAAMQSRKVIEQSFSGLLAGKKMAP